MQAATFVMAGSASAILFVLYSSSRILSRRSGTTVLHILFAFSTLSLIFMGLVRAHLASDTPNLNRIALAVAGALFVIGILATLVERRNHGQVSGLVISATGVLLGLLILVTPLVVSQITTVREQRSSTVAATLQPVVWSAATTEQPSTLDTANSLPQNANNPPRSFSLAPLPTRYTPITPTVTPLAQAEQRSVCIGTVQNNLNLRTGAGAHYELLTTIPYTTRVEIYARNADGSWLVVGYGEQEGWVSAQYIVLDVGCDELPERDL
jgi:hypothetical protein